MRRDYIVQLNDLTNNAFVGIFTCQQVNAKSAIADAIQQAGLFHSGHLFGATMYYKLPNGLNSPTENADYQTLVEIH